MARFGSYSQQCFKDGKEGYTQIIHQILRNVIEKRNIPALVLKTEIDFVNQAWMKIIFRKDLLVQMLSFTEDITIVCIAGHFAVVASQNIWGYRFLHSGSSKIGKILAEYVLLHSSNFYFQTSIFMTCIVYKVVSAFPHIDFSPKFQITYYP